MLITRTAARGGTVVPVFYLLAGAGILALSLAFLLKESGGKQIAGVVVCLLLGGGTLWHGIVSCRVLRATDDDLVVRSLRKELTLRRSACAFGVRVQAGGRGAIFTVFVTDARATNDVAEFATEKGARRAIQRLERGLLPAADPADRQLQRARKQVAKVEHEWQERVAPALKAVKDYYASPRWRGTVLVVVVLVILYTVGMSIAVSPAE